MDMEEGMTTEAAAEVDHVEEVEDRLGIPDPDPVMTVESRPCERIGAGSAGARRELDR
jgi:hypothetical protein